MYAARNDQRIRSWESQASHRLRFVFAVLFILLASTSVAQWSTQSPVPTYLDVRGVAAPTSLV